MTVNLGTGSGTSVMQLIDAVERVVGRSVPRRLQPRRPGDMPILVAATDMAGSLLGWRPRFVELDDMISSAFAWMERPVTEARTARR